MKTHDKTRTIDWQACERDFRAGVMSLREMGLTHGVAESAIRKRAKRDEWTRDLRAKIQAKADELVRKQEVRTLVRTEGAVSDKMQIQAMGQRVADVQMGHKAIAARGMKLCQALLAELETQTTDTVVLAQLGELMRNPDDSGTDRLNDIYKKVISTPGRVDTAKKLVETMKSVIGLEREAYSIGTTPEEAASNGVAAFLAGMKRSALPVVHDVPADDDH
jgi:hypothetical protein